MITAYALRARRTDSVLGVGLPLRWWQSVPGRPSSAASTECTWIPSTVWPRVVPCRGRLQRTRSAMENSVDDKPLPGNADLTQLRAQAKELRRAFAGGSPAVVARVRAILPGSGTEIALRDAQLVIAREHGFEGWRDLAAAVVAQQSGGRDLDRWFGVELNNSTWDLIDNGLSERSPRAEQEQALYAAYAAAYHWMQAGTVANHGRAEHLIAIVAVAIGMLDVAQRHADRYAELIAAHPAAFADWDRASAAEAAARVASRAGRRDAAQLKAEARRLAEAVEHPVERRICVQRLATAPW